MSEIKEKNEQIKTWENALIASYFFILFHGIRLALEDYLLEESLPITLTMLLGLFSAIITALVVFILNGKKLMIKGFGAVILLALVTIANLLVS